MYILKSVELDDIKLDVVCQCLAPLRRDLLSKFMYFIY